MKRLLTVSALALALGACATATPYVPAGQGRYAAGYREARIEADRWRVTFSGNSLTSRDTVEMYMLYRAAELTVQQGYDWFETGDRVTTRDVRTMGIPDPWWGDSAWGPYWRPSWRFYRRGFWSPWDPFWDIDYDVQLVTSYEAAAEIYMHRGARPAGDRHAFDAREVIANLGPRVVRPQPRR